MSLNKRLKAIEQFLQREDDELDYKPDCGEPSPPTIRIPRRWASPPPPRPLARLIQEVEAGHYAGRTVHPLDLLPLLGVQWAQAIAAVFIQHHGDTCCLWQGDRPALVLTMQDHATGAMSLSVVARPAESTDESLSPFIWTEEEAPHDPA